MEDNYSDYVEIEQSTIPGLKSQEKFFTKSLPNVIVSTVPVELQEFSYISEEKAHRISYSYRPTTKLNFKNSQLSSPLKTKLHKHDYFELLVISSGQLEMQIESQLCEFNQWDVCILNRSTRHAEQFVPKEKIFYLALSSEYISTWPWEEGMNLQRSMIFSKLLNVEQSETLQQKKDFITARFTHQTTTSPLNKIINDIRQQFTDKQPGYQLMVRGLLYRFFNILNDPQYYQTEYINLGSDQGFALAFSAKKILDRNKRKMTKGEVAEELNYNSEYINRVFKKHYGLTISEYNKAICVNQAAFQLTNTDLHIHQICNKLGFTNRTHFYELFRSEFGCTPAEYRRRGAKS